MNYWTEPYKEIAARIRANISAINHIDLWHEQVSYLTEELPFTTPALFLAFSTIDTQDRGLFIQDVITQIDMYLFYETFSDTYDDSMNRDRALEYLERLSELHALFHGKPGTTFSEMRRVDMRREDSGGAGNLYRISFQCLINDTSAAILFTETQNPEAQVDIKNEALPERATPDKIFDV